MLEAVAQQAGALGLRHFHHAAADREVEAFLAAELGARFPEAGILGEEGSARAAAGPYRFVLDPIDGTAVFVAGLPTWCVSIGVLEGERAVAGVVHVPCARETYSAVGGEARWNGTALPPLAGAVAADDPFLLVHAKAHLRHRLGWPGRALALGSAAYQAALVARGAAAAAILGRVHLWDLAAVAALLDAVGGTLRYVSGAPVVLGALADGRRTADYVAAGTPARLDALLPRLGARA